MFQVWKISHFFWTLKVTDEHGVGGWGMEGFPSRENLMHSL